MKFLFLIALGTFFYSSADAQIAYSENLQSHVDSIINNMINVDGSNDYKTPTVQQITVWDSIISNMLSANYAVAESLANDIDYRLLAFTDNSQNPSKLYYVLENTSLSTNFWGTFIYNPSPQRSKLFIQSPHPKYEFNSGKQGFYIFREIGAIAFFVTGTNRCNNDTLTTCDGTTTVCTGASEAYRISDQPHVVSGTLYKTAEVMENEINNMITIQLHGFTKGVGDPDLIMSNGIQSATPSIDYLDLLRTNLIAEDNTLTYVIVHEDQNWSKLR